MKGAEALVRWRHPQFGIVRPAAFMGVVEATDLIEDLTSLMVREVVRDSEGGQISGLNRTVEIPF